MLNKKSRIFVAGHNGMVGSAIYRLLSSKGYTNLITEDRANLDLKKQQDVLQFYKKRKPEIVINVAAKVGGILANKNDPYGFLLDNMLIQNNLIDGALKSKVDKFIFLGSSCIYPKYAPQPLKEEYLLTGSLEPTNESYAIAKISGVKLCESINEKVSKKYISLMPTNLYGYNDNFDVNNSHVIPAMIIKFHLAKKNNDKVTLLGTGEPLREFLFVDDLADAILVVIENNINKGVYNVGSGDEISIKNLANLVKNIVGFEGELFLGFK